MHVHSADRSAGVFAVPGADEISALAATVFPLAPVARNTNIRPLLAAYPYSAFIQALLQRQRDLAAKCNVAGFISSDRHRNRTVAGESTSFQLRERSGYERF